MQARAIIADDESPSRAHVRKQLLAAWPGLDICGEAENGVQALELIRRLRPDVAFLDIRMPGLSGMAVAGKVAGTCPVVFITAYDRFAIEAFENEAVDYILKPVDTDRLAVTVQRIRSMLAEAASRQDLSAAFERLARRLEATAEPRYLNWIRVPVDEAVRLIPVEQVAFFQARNKYTAVVSREAEGLIRKPIYELAAELDPERFVRIHRGTIVNAALIEKVSVSATGRGQLKLRGRTEIHTVSRSYTHLFKPM